MTDLNRTQAEFDKLFRELLRAEVERKMALDLISRYRTQSGLAPRVQFVERNFVPTGILSNVRLSGGTLKLGEHTTEAGEIIVRIQDGVPSGSNTITFYKATGGASGDKIAEGTGADSATDVELAEQNSSGLTFLVDLGTIAGSESDDVRRLFARPDAVLSTYLFDGTEPSHPVLRGSWLDACEAAADAAQSAMDAWLGWIQTFIRTRWATFFEASDRDQVPVAHEITSTDGLTKDVRTSGLLETARSAMAQNTPVAQTVVKNVVSATSPAADTNNTGKGSLAIGSVDEWALPGTVTWRCTSSLVGRERFRATMLRDDTGEQIEALSELTVGKPWSDPKLGLRNVTLTRTLELESGIANDFADPPNDWTIEGESPGNTDSGKLHLKIEENATPGTFRIALYRSSNQIESNVVARTAYGAAAATVAIVSGSLTGTLKLGASPTDGNTGILDLQAFQTEGGSSPNLRADFFTATISVTSRGDAQRLFAEGIVDALEGRYALNSAAAGAETIAEGMATAGGLVPHSSKDVF